MAEPASQAHTGLFGEKNNTFKVSDSKKHAICYLPKILVAAETAKVSESLCYTFVPVVKKFLCLVALRERLSHNNVADLCEKAYPFSHLSAVSAVNY